MTALIIRGGTVVNRDHSRRADVLVDGETIVAIGSPLDAPSGAGVIDAGDCYVMPGGMPVVLTKLCRRLATPAQPVGHHRPPFFFKPSRKFVKTSEPEFRAIGKVD